MNESRTFNQLERLLGVEADRPRLRVERAPVSRTAEEPSSGFARRLGTPNGSWTNEWGVTGIASTGDEVRLGLSDRATTPRVRSVLVHEYTHAVQYQRGWHEAAQRLSLQSPAAAHALSEGGATYVATAYAERDGETASDRQRVCEQYQAGDAATKLNFAPYCVGARYIDDRIDDPANLGIVYENPPNTTEQLRHNYSPSEEPPAALPVTATGTENWSVVREPADGTSNRRGELWTYAVLTAHLSESRADTAATGWGNDTRVTFGSLDGTGDAWVTRWDTERDADEFEGAIADHVANISTGYVTDASFRVVRVDATTVVLFAGSGTFVDGASATATDAGGVLVRPPNATARLIPVAGRPVRLG
ncbi:hypothetical protein [Haloarchaeobius baliensis]|uniref:hypothetical protein n=1 Tax=Haloarchaeobius baliensis TaxID=1670458 RepID=UPI003F883042